MSSHRLVPVFDLGNVIVQVDFQHFHKWFGDLANLEPESVWPHIAASNHYFRYERDEVDCEGFAEALRKEFNTDFNYADFRERFCDIFPGWIPGMAELIQELNDKKVPFYGLSNTCRMHVESLYEKHPDIMGLFKTLHTSYEMKLRKPDPKIYQELSARIGREPGELVFFDDLPENVSVARECGLQAHLFEDAAQVREILVGI